MKRDFFSDEGKKAYEVCLQHYIERGNTEELAHQIVDHLNEEDIFRTYEIIQQEKNVEESGADRVRRNDICDGGADLPGKEPREHVSAGRGLLLADRASG